MKRKKEGNLIMFRQLSQTVAKQKGEKTLF